MAAAPRPATKNASSPNAANSTANVGADAASVGSGASDDTKETASGGDGRLRALRARSRR